MSPKSESAAETESPLDEAIADFLHRQECGESIDPQAFIAEHPELAAELGEYFAADAEFNELLDEVMLEEMLAVGPPTERDLDANSGGDLSGVGAFGPDAEHPPAPEPQPVVPDENESPAPYAPPPNALAWKIAALSAVVLLAVGLIWLAPRTDVGVSSNPAVGNSRPFVDPSVVWSGSTAQATEEQRAIWAARPKQLVGHWLLQRVDGKVVRDQSSFHHDGKVHGSPTPSDGGLIFSGNNQYVDLGAPPELNFDGPITVVAWVRVQQTNSIRNIVAHGHQTGPNAEVYLRVKEGRFEVGSWNGGDSAVGIAIAPKDIDQWVHLAGTYDGTHWRIYRNGVEAANRPGRFGAFEMRSAWAIASRGGAPSRFFGGGVRDVRIYNYALSAEKVAELAQ